MRKYFVFIVTIFFTLSASIPSQSLAPPAGYIITPSEFKNSYLKGSVTTLLRLLRSILHEHARYYIEDINVMITFECQLNCKMCVAGDTKRHGEMDTATLYSLFDQLTGHKKVHIVGTREPTTYGKKNVRDINGVSKVFIDLVHYAAARVKELHIVTNGAVVPYGEKEAEEFFAQFPKNIVWVVSADKWHERELAKRVKRNLRKIIAVMEKLADRRLIQTAYALTVETDEEIVPTLRHFGIQHKWKKNEYDYDDDNEDDNEDDDADEEEEGDDNRKNSIIIQGVISQGNAVRNNIQFAHRFDDKDVFEHAENIQENLFIDPDGYVLTSAHVAYMNQAQRKKYSDDYTSIVLGNINDKPLAEIIIDSFLFRNCEEDLIDPFLFYNRPGKYKKVYTATRLNRMELARLGKHSFKDILRIVFTATLYFINGDKQTAHRLMKSLAIDESIDDNKSRRHNIHLNRLIVNIAYHLFRDCYEPGVKEFMLECIGNKALKTGFPSEIVPSMEKALYLLEYKKELRGCFEEEILNWHRFPQWVFADGLRFACPFYTKYGFAKNFDRHREDDDGVYYYMVSIMRFRQESTHARGYECTVNDAFIKQYASDYEFALQGFVPWPIGIVNDTNNGKTYYMVEAMAHKYELGTQLGYIQEKQKKTLAKVAHIGRFAARLEHAGLLIKPGKDIIRRKIYLDDDCLDYVLKNSKLISPDGKSPKEVIKQSLLSVFISQFGRYGKKKPANFNELKSMIAETFDQGFSYQMERLKNTEPILFSQFVKDLITSN